MRKLLFIFLFALNISFADAKCGVPTTKRHKEVAHRFMVMTGYPKGRPGWIVDHIIPLCKGGPDATTNMQWQTVAEAKAKDKVECRCNLKK